MKLRQIAGVQNEMHSASVNLPLLAVLSTVELKLALLPRAGQSGTAEADALGAGGRIGTEGVTPIAQAASEIFRSEPGLTTGPASATVLNNMKQV